MTPVERPRAKRIALTFDDGPGVRTGDLLDALFEEEVPATFFLVGEHAQQHPEIVARLANTPEIELGNHSRSHTDLTKASDRSVVDETARNKELLESLVGRPIRLFRPPWGRHDKRVDRAAEASNQSLVLYSLDSKDWQHKSETMTVDRVVSSAVDGDIILFHDTLPSTVNAARQLVGELKRAGFTMVTVSTLLGETTPGRCYDGVIGRRTRWRRWAEVQGRAWRSRLGRLARIRPLRSTQ